MTRTDHCDGRKFFNPRISGDKTLGEVVRWITSTRRKKWPARVANKGQPHPATSLPADEAAVTFIGHSTFLLQLPGLNILTDPVFSERASPVSWAGPMRVRPPGLALRDLPAIQAVVISHNHYDHMDLPSLKKIRAIFDPLFITPLGNGRPLRRKDIKKVIELDWWQSHQVKGGITVTLTPAQHFSCRSLLDRNDALWAGFFIASDVMRIYFAGDSGYEKHFKEIQDRLGRPDLALLPIGAYEPRWFMRANHMNPEEAVQAHTDLSARQSIATHFGTFQLTNEGIDEPVESLRRSLAARRLEPNSFRALEFGETLLVSGGAKSKA
jgi:L-ascorbate metabolism protein UlaG (beta-lactamase superfamily)